MVAMLRFEVFLFVVTAVANRIGATETDSLDFHNNIINIISRQYCWYPDLIESMSAEELRQVLFN